MANSAVEAAGNVDKYIGIYFGNLETIIPVLLVLFLVFATISLILSFRNGSNSSDGFSVGIDTKDLEKSLKKVLETAELKAASITGSVGASAVNVPDNIDGVNLNIDLEGAKDESIEEVEALKQVITAKYNELQDLKGKIAELEANGGGSTEGVSGPVDSEEMVSLKAKVSDLEAKLSEYEIIEDDIANLSLYKEENSKLKEEIEKLKAGGSVAAAEPVAKEPTEEKVETAVEAKEPEVAAEEKPEEVAEQESDTTAEGADDDIMAEFAAAVEEQKAEEAGATSEPQAAAPEEESAEDSNAVAESEQSEGTSDDIMAEFAAAVEEQKAEEAGATTEPQAAAPEEEPAEVSKEVADSEQSEGASDDIMAEFAAAVEEQKTEEQKAEEAELKQEVAEEPAPQQATAESVPEPKDETNDDDIMAEFTAAVEEQKTEENVASASADQEVVEESNEQQADLTAEVPEPVVAAIDSEDGDDDDDDDDDDDGSGGSGSNSLMDEFVSSPEEIQAQEEAKAKEQEELRKQAEEAEAAKKAEEEQLKAEQAQKEEEEKKRQQIAKDAGVDASDDEAIAKAMQLAEEEAAREKERMEAISSEEDVDLFEVVGDLAKEVGGKEIEASQVDTLEASDTEDATPPISIVKAEASSSDSDLDSFDSESIMADFSQALMESKEERIKKEAEIDAKVKELELNVKEAPEIVDDSIVANFRDAINGKQAVEELNQEIEENNSKPSLALVTNESEPEKTEVSAEVPEFLSREPDPDKILGEMGDLIQAGSESSEEEEGDPGEKLISEFESFGVTKESS